MGAERCFFMGWDALRGRERSKSDFLVDRIFATSFWMAEPPSGATGTSGVLTGEDGACRHTETTGGCAAGTGTAMGITAGMQARMCVVCVMVRVAVVTWVLMSAGKGTRERPADGAADDERIVSPEVP